MMMAASWVLKRACMIAALGILGTMVVADDMVGHGTVARVLLADVAYQQGPSVSSSPG